MPNLDYHKAVIFVKNNKMEVIPEKLSQSLLEGTCNNFWNLVKHLKNKSAKIANVVDGCISEDSICELFAIKYEVLYNLVSFKENGISKVKSVTDSSNTINCQSGKCYSSHTVNVSDICNAIKCLKKGKGDGFHTCMSDYTINGTKTASIYLSLVMSVFLAVLKPWPFRNSKIIYLAILKPSRVLKRPCQFKTWFQNGQINNLAILKPRLISKFFYSMCFYMYKM